MVGSWVVGVLVKIALKVFTVMSFVFGLDLKKPTTTIEPSPKPVTGSRAFRKTLLYLMRAFDCISLAVYGSVYVEWESRQLQDVISTSDLIEAFSYATATFLTIVIFTSLWKNQAFLQNLFASVSHTTVNRSHLLLWFFCWVYWGGADLAFWTTYPFFVDEPILIAGACIGRTMIMFTIQVQFFTFGLFIMSENILLKRLEHLDSQLLSRNHRQILADKQEIRDLTAGLNRTLSNVLAVMYVRIFFILYGRFVIVANLRDKTSHLVRLALSPVFYVVNLFLMSSIATRITDQCEKTNFRLRTTKLSELTSEEQSFVREVLAFERLQDSLSIWQCFTHSKDTFISYLGAIVTCLAILIQFDYRTMALLDRSKANYLANASKEH